MMNITGAITKVKEHIKQCNPHDVILLGEIINYFEEDDLSDDDIARLYELIQEANNELGNIIVTERTLLEVMKESGITKEQWLEMEEEEFIDILGKEIEDFSGKCGV